MNAGPEIEADLRRNGLLHRLDADSLAGIARHLDRVKLPVPRPLYEDGKPMRHVYFPIEGVISVLAPHDVGRRIEVGTIGREGFAGLPLFFGARKATGDAFMQVDGEGWRMPAEIFLQEVGSNARLVEAVHAYAQSYFVQLSQAIACNSAHSPEQRCARWLLMTRDRVSSDSFMLRQEFLAQMLGERRVTVSKVASKLRERGLIAYSRGVITIKEPQRLEDEACACYDVMRAHYEGLLKSQ